MKKLDASAWFMGTCVLCMTVWLAVRCAAERKPAPLPPQVLSAEPTPSTKPKTSKLWMPVKELGWVKGSWQGEGKAWAKFSMREDVPNGSGSIYPWKLRMWPGGDASVWPIECGFYPRIHEADGLSFRVSYCVGGSLQSDGGGTYAKRLTLDTDGIHLRIQLGSDVELELEPRRPDSGQ